MNQELSIGLSQRPAMTPELRQSIEILQMSAVELKATIEREFLENPALELEYLDDENFSDETARSDGEEFFNANTSQVDDENFSDEVARSDDEEFFNVNTSQVDDENFFEPPAPVSTTLENFLTEQASFAFDGRELSVAKFLIGNLDERGYLTLKISDAAQILNVAEDVVEKILRRVQTFEPAGVAARNLSECLRLQAERQNIFSGTVAAIIEKHLPAVAANKIKDVARAEKISVDEVRRAIEIIRTLNPKPANSFGGTETKFVVPDVNIKKIGTRYEIFLNSTLPRVKISADYSELKNFDAETKNYLTRHLNSARQLIRSIRQREKTLLRVVEAIVRRQKKFLDGGRQFLKPMTMRELADELNVHESTISRAVANKFAQVPFGVIELRKIFSAALSKSVQAVNSHRDVPTNSNAVSAEQVKALIAELIKAENSASPLSDQALTEILSSRGISVARRTVMKYREQLGILSSTKRRRP